ncbi:MAG: dihydroneopterin aldolase [Carbonactinosporaceae bacterium]
MTDRVTLRGLRGRGRHGVLERERDEGQTFVVDVALGIDARKAAATDDLADTVDYGELAIQVIGVVEGEPVNLVETLAERIADVCLAHSPVEEVEITVHKPDAPVAVPFDDVRVTISRRRT